MEYVVGLLLLVAAVLLARWVVRRHLANEKRERLAAEARSFMRTVKRQGRFEAVETHVNLRRGEVAFYSEPATLLETRAVRHYESGSIGVRVVKGIWVGRSRGRSLSTQEWTHLDDGELVVTNRRVMFDGRRTNRVIELRDIMSTNFGLDYVELASSRRQKSMVFSARNPILLAAMLRLCCQLDDPTSFDPEAVSVEIR